ncbi:MAG: hypothetical protein WC702_00210 [Patescibacteria group bacterium]
MKILRTRSFKYWEIGLIKICLLSLGILLGLYFFDYLIGLLWLWWLLLAVTTIYFIIKLIREG